MACLVGVVEEARCHSKLGRRGQDGSGEECSKGSLNDWLNTNIWRRRGPVYVPVVLYVYSGGAVRAEGPVVRAEGPVGKAEGLAVRAEGPVRRAEGPSAWHEGQTQI